MKLNWIQIFYSIFVKQHYTFLLGVSILISTNIYEVGGKKTINYFHLYLKKSEKCDVHGCSDLMTIIPLNKPLLQ